ncbi:S8 family serine peptidase [Streptomyces sp. NPDC046887]|uniref:S8 family serine peptidase n=1 Tax=Streptomyces sp. NPDC046887 TaxID=3155472 RepID=UPI0033C831D6
MHVDEIWKSTKGEGIKVAVIDSGVNDSVPSLRGQILSGRDFTGVKGDEKDDYTGHGTTMAELIAGTGRGGGLQGLAPEAKIIPYRVADTEMQNNNKVNAFDIRQAIRAAADSDAQIISMSWGSEYYSHDVRDAIEYAQAKGKLFFAAVGNSGDKGNAESYPGAYPEAVAVGATTSEGRVAKFSQHGDKVDISAPGADLLGWCDETFTRYCKIQGTSGATALASATAALIWSKHPEWTGNQVLRVMFESAGRGENWEPGTVSRQVGHGVVRPNAHITRGLGKPGDPDVSPDTGKRVGGKPGSASKSPTPGTSKQAPDAAPSGDNPALAGSASGKADDSGGTNSAYLIGGAIAATAVLAGAGALVARRRRQA